MYTSSNIHWQVQFRSLRANTLYTVSIYDGNYSGDPILLTGAGQPFETQEEKSDDVFKPVRKQTGYLRIVDNGYAADGVTPFNWRDFIPTTDIDRPVKLTHVEGSTTVVDWEGFLQAQNFGASLFETPAVREFPVHCPLTILSRSDASTDNKRIRTFAWMLWSALNSIPAYARPVTIVIQGGADARDWMRKMVDWMDFVEQSRDFTAKAKYDYGTMLEDMCAFWGFTARVQGDTFYLVCADDQAEDDSLTLTYAELSDLAIGDSVGSIDTMFSTVTIGDIFARTDNKDYQNRGPNTALVKVDSNNAADNVIEPFDAELEKEMNRADWSEGYVEQDGDEYWHYSKDVTEVERCDLIGVASDHPNHSPQWRGASFNILQVYNTADGSSGYTDVGNVIHINRTYNGFAFMTLETIYEHCFSDGFFRMFATTYRKGQKYENGNFYAGNPAMKMKLGIGITRENAMWWDGRAWQSTECMFLATIGNKKPELFSRYEVSAYSNEQTSIIETGTALYGRMFLEFFGTDDSRVTDINGQKSFDLLDFRIEYQKNDNVTKQQYPNSGWWDVKKNLDIPTLEYEAKSDSMVKEDYNVDLPYGSNDGIQPGYGILMNGNGTYMSTAPFAGVDERPEVHLANRIIGYWSTAKRRIECSLRTHDGTAATAAAGISPKKMVQIDGTTLYPYSISHKWRDDMVSLVTMQTEISEPPVVVTYMVSGVVTDGTNPLSGVVVTLGSLTTTTGADGSYSFEDVDAGSYTLSATKSGYTFTPITVSVSADTTQNITMSVVVMTYTVSGNVTDGTNMLSGVVVTLGNQSVTSGNNGAFTFNNVEAGTYTLSATKSGYSFAPISLVVAGDTTKLIEMLPYDAEVEYLQSSGTQYINLNKTLVSSTDVVDIDFMITQNTGTTDGVFGARSSASQNNFSSLSASSTDSIIIDINNGSYANYRLNSNESATNKRCVIHMERANKSIKYDGVVIASSTTSSASFTTSRVAYLFFTNLMDYKAHMRVYSLQWRRSGDLLFDLIPVRKNGVGYLYDKVSGTLFGNAGTGSFTYGNDK